MGDDVEPSRSPSWKWLEAEREGLCVPGLASLSSQDMPLLAACAERRMSSGSFGSASVRAFLLLFICMMMGRREGIEGDDV